ncbi:hypothetical protein B0H21DRAFT_369629 [Amylocystis lapponica]|nr:hypothetical protein B0H21DRAFT_369629 [Amylocystis lapponica]
MTWVLGWPVTIEFARQYVEEHGLLPNTPHTGDHVLDATAHDLGRRSGLNKYYPPFLCCWVDDDIECIFGLCVDRHAKSEISAVRRLRPHHLPPIECAERLLTLLGTTDGPYWYRYDDDTWDPRDEKEPAAHSTSEEAGASGAQDREGHDGGVEVDAHDTADMDMADVGHEKHDNEAPRQLQEKVIEPEVQGQLCARLESCTV